MAMSRGSGSKGAPRGGGGLAGPYFEWARATGYAYYGQAEWLPLLIELQNSPLRLGNAQAFAAFVLKRQAVADGSDWVNDLRVPQMYLECPARMSTSPTCISVLARRRFLDAIYLGNPPAASIRRCEVGRANLPRGVLPQPVIDRRVNPGGGPLVVPEVITAVIDDGIAFAHDRFFDNLKGTRIEHVWDQEYPSLEWFDVGYGREIGKRDPVDGIDRLMILSTHAGRVDEDEVYRRSGQIDTRRRGRQPLAQRASHGTHVADLACNAPVPVNPYQAYVPYQRPPPGKRPVIVVQLPTLSVEDSSGASLAPQIFNGVFYAILRADQLAARYGCDPVPLVINVSYGIFDGPHDGSSLFEELLDGLIQLCNTLVPDSLRVLLPAGNNHLSRCHALFDVATNSPKVLRWRVLPDDRTETWVEVRLPVGTNPSQVDVKLSAPNGVDHSGWVAGGAMAPVQIGGQMVGSVDARPGFPSARPCVTVFLAPTASSDAGMVLAPAGLWRIEVRNRLGTALQGVDAWIRRDDPAPGCPRRGRQSYFDDPNYQRFDAGGRVIEKDGPTMGSDVRRDGTFNGLATGRQPLVVGGFRRSDRAPAPYSASGPVPRQAAAMPGGADGPEAMLPCDDSPSHFGVLAAGTRSGSCVAMQGTSVAAPLATRWVAERMVSKQPSDRYALFQHAVAKDPAASDKPPAKRGGGGRIPFPSNRLPR
jgi:hypothetical protein